MQLCHEEDQNKLNERRRCTPAVLPMQQHIGVSEEKGHTFGCEQVWNTQITMTYAPVLKGAAARAQNEVQVPSEI